MEAISLEESGEVLYNFLVENKVSMETARRIVTDYVENDRLPDSASNVEPINSIEIEEENGTTTRLLYPDGSVSTSYIQTESGMDGGVEARAIQQCPTYSGSGYRYYRNCVVTGSNGIVTIGFSASYTLVDGAYDYISDYGSPYQFCAGAVCDTPYLAGVKLNEDYYGNAWVQYNVRSTLANGGSRTSLLYISIGGNAAASYFQF